MERQFLKFPRWCVGLAVLLTMLLSMPVSQGLAQGTMVVIDPPAKEVAVGATTTVDVRIENVANLYGAEVQLVFNPALLEVVDTDTSREGVQIQPGSLLSPDFMAKNNADQTTGRIVFAVAQMPPHEPVNGSGILATITFRGKAAGTSEINFSTTQPTPPAILSNRDGMPISASTQGGSIKVTGGPTLTPTATPKPTTTATPTPTPTPAKILGYHTVKAKETLYCIGRAYNVDPYAIARQNSIVNPNVIRVGHKLAIPNVPYRLPAGKACPRQFDGTPTPRCRWTHKVERGENLYRISLRYKVSMWTIAETNHITNLNYIRAGQELCIP
jgi:LysM repeat protein